jgi:hypothetical protein
MAGEDAAFVEAAWRKLEADWDHEEAHRRFISFCAQHGVLDQAGRRYRAVRDTDASRSQNAAMRLNAVTLAAIEQLSLARAARPPKPRRLMWLVVGACGFVIIQAVLALLRRGSH